ncbi:hypothetical protein [Geosporobacter ferrireducens]|uniref:DUF4363 domain-containing protein n=2 Tax=Geosporobacter ferrireducens TaxID=1424294 RepID=A0A1D8GEH2_9FIRM|nr:hypothetical protein [Geosporobacter ferrireducens]AOT69315.1 hypothetical protein Gferi_06865 [Geosporobacter ferrireducens]MTI57001.1 hypothetical protein [Geosporobacter ferrireducens]
MMNNLLYMISTSVIIGCILVLFYYCMKLLSAVINRGKSTREHKKIDETMSKLDNTILLSVMTVNKSMVDRLKESQSFFQQEKEEAFHEAKDRIMNIINEEEIQCLNTYIGNIDEWINNRIEYYVKILKK